jgi:uncharacterized protein
MLEICIGLAGGTLIGSTGAGLGLIVTPLLICCGYSPLVAVGTGLAVAAIAKLVGASVHHRLGHWPDRFPWVLVGGGAAGVIIPWWLIHTWLSPAAIDLNLWIKRLLAGMLILAALLLARGASAWRRTAKQAQSSRWQFGIGLGVGMIETLTSAGSGTLLVPALAATTDWDVPELAAASNLFGCIVGALSLEIYAPIGAFDPRLFAKVLIGLLPGVAAGALLSRSISRVWLLRGASAVTFALGTRFLFH